jgi:hypothetical protein
MPTTTPGSGDESRKAYVAGIDSICGARFLISWADWEDNEFGSVVVVAMERDRKAEARLRTARMIGSVKEDIGAIFDRWRVFFWCGIY